FQAEDGIRADLVTGVQTCALPICFALSGVSLVTGVKTAIFCGFPPSNIVKSPAVRPRNGFPLLSVTTTLTFTRCEAPRNTGALQIGRASCRERGKSTMERVC